jgi:T5SS/PEP-CTERM-associated repeat protein
MWGIAPAAALTRSWNNSAGGSFTVAANWSPAVVPGVSDLAVFRRGAAEAYTTTFPGKLNFPLPVYAFDQLRVGNNQATFTDSLAVGQAPGSVTVANPTTAIGGRAIVVGESDTDTAASLTTSLAHFSATALTVGDAPGSQGTLSVTSGTLTVTGSSATDDELIIGYQGKGVLNVASGAIVTTADLVIGDANGSRGTVDVNGGMLSVASSNAAEGRLVVGRNGKGELVINSGGIVSAKSMLVDPMGLRLNKQHDVTVQGPGSLLHVDATLTVGQQPATTDEFNDIDFLIQNGGAVEAGQMNVLSHLLVNSGGTVDGEVVNEGGFIIVGNQGLLAPDSGLHVHGNYNQRSSSTSSVSALEIYVLDPSHAGRLDVDGDVTLEDGHATLIISNPVGVQNNWGEVFDVLDWTGAFNGTFSQIQVPPLAPGLAWDTSQIYSTGMIRVIRPGDFDLDLDVDGADLLVWQRGGSPSPNSPGDLAAWKANVGQSAASAVAAVPEPYTISLLLAAASMIVAAGTRGSDSSDPAARGLAAWRRTREPGRRVGRTPRERFFDG